MYRVFLLLGSNLGNRYRNLEDARREINDHAGQIVRKSSIYKTAAWGKTDQPDFYNQVVEIITRQQPEALLGELLAIEKRLGRVRDQKWSERLIDIDILFYGHLQLDLPGLSVPHPRIPERRFTLEPLAEIAPELVHPELNKTVSELLAVCPDPLTVTRLVS